MSTILFIYIESLSATIMGTHKACFVILFVWFVYLASMSVELINQEVQSLFPTSQDSGFQIRKWKQDFCCVYRFIEKINYSFGPCLVVFMASEFIFFAFFPYKLYSDWRAVAPDHEDHEDFIWRIIPHFIYMILVMYTSNILRNKVWFNQFMYFDCISWTVSVLQFYSILSVWQISALIYTISFLRFSNDTPQPEV